MAASTVRARPARKRRRHLSEAIGLVNLFVPRARSCSCARRAAASRCSNRKTRALRTRPAHDPRRSIQCLRVGDLAAAMQDTGRGLVIGQQTYGKARCRISTRSTVCDGTGSGLRPADRDDRYVLPVTGDSTQNRGVAPDLLLPSAISTDEVGESSRTVRCRGTASGPPISNPKAICRCARRSTTSRSRGATRALPRTRTSSTRHRKSRQSRRFARKSRFR